MPETVLFESEQRMSRGDVATYLRTVADKLETGQDITFAAGSESVTMSPPERPTFEVKVEREGPTDGPGELGIEFELEWDEDGDGNGAGGEFRIE